MREIRTSGSTRGSGRRALLRKRRLSLSTLPHISGLSYAGFPFPKSGLRRAQSCRRAGNWNISRALEHYLDEGGQDEIIGDRLPF